MDGDAFLSWPERLFLLTFALLYFGVPALLAWVTYCNEGVFKKIDLREMWSVDGRADPLRAIMLGSWWVHTCTIILWTLSKQITTADFLAYGGVWVTPIITEILKRPSTPKTVVVVPPAP